MPDEKRTVFIPFGVKPIAEMTLTEIIEEINMSRQGMQMLKREVETLRALLVDEIIGVTMQPREPLDKKDEPVVDSTQSGESDEKKGNFQA